MTPAEIRALRETATQGELDVAWGAISRVVEDEHGVGTVPLLRPEDGEACDELDALMEVLCAEHNAFPALAARLDKLEAVAKVTKCHGVGVVDETCRTWVASIDNWCQTCRALAALEAA